VTTADGSQLLYVGRTGDSSSANAQSAFNRMGAHLGTNEKSNVLRKRLRNLNIAPEDCEFRLVTYGPIFGEAPEKTTFAHEPLRDLNAALEKKLAEELLAAGYQVINTVHCKRPLNTALYAHVREAFAASSRSSSPNPDHCDARRGPLRPRRRLHSVLCAPTRSSRGPALAGTAPIHEESRRLSGG
jgi:hypothetical protein